MLPTPFWAVRIFFLNLLYIGDYTTYSYIEILISYDPYEPISILGYHFRVFVHVEISTWPISPRKSWSCTSPNVFMWVMLPPLRWVSNCQCVRSFHNRNLGLNWVGQAVLVGLFIYVRESLGRWIMGNAQLKWAGWLSSHDIPWDAID